jgi:hypothetical protein
MPTIPLDEFEDAPDIGDKVTVKGKVVSINEETEEVEISYDSVKVGNKEKKKSDNDDDDDDDDDDVVVVRDELTVDEALARSFPPSQPAGPGAIQA